jgi:hypothetical protein
MLNSVDGPITVLAEPTGLFLIRSLYAANPIEGLPTVDETARVLQFLADILTKAPRADNIILSRKEAAQKFRRRSLDSGGQEVLITDIIITGIAITD